MLPKALREYDSVSAEPHRPTAASPTRRRACAVGVDVRRFRGSGRSPATTPSTSHSVAALYAGDPPSPDAWRDADRARAARTRGTRRRSLRVLAAQQERRGAPPAARGRGGAARRPGDRRRRHRPAGRRVRRTALHAAQGGHRDPARARVADASTARPVVAGVLGRRRGSRLGGGRGAVRCSTREFQPRTITLAAPEGAGELPVAALELDERVERRHRRARRRARRRPTSPPGSLAALRAAYRPGVGMADAFATLDRSAARPARPGRVRVGRSGGQAARRGRLRAASCARRAAPRRSPPRPAKRSPARGHAPQVVPQPDSVVAVPSRRRPHADQAAGRPLRRRRRRPRARRRSSHEAATRSRSGSARTCCSARSCRTRSSRRSVTSPGRASSPISDSCAASTSTSACRCR